jgi:hypothetical protein
LTVLFHPENCAALTRKENSAKNNRACAAGLELVKKYRPDLVDAYIAWGQDYGWYGEAIRDAA